MKLSFSERIHERIAVLFPLPAALTAPIPAEAALADAAIETGAEATPAPLTFDSPTPFGMYRLHRPAPDAGWSLEREGEVLLEAADAAGIARHYHQDLADRLGALMATHAAVAELTGTISGREPGGKKWTLDVTGDGLLRMVALGLREPGL